jgi:hypothetical protein
MELWSNKIRPTISDKNTNANFHIPNVEGERAQYLEKVIELSLFHTIISDCMARMVVILLSGDAGSNISPETCYSD